MKKEFNSKHTKKLTVKAQMPVKNHPAITVITPEILYTALSRSQAPSANEDPIATMKVTYVVDKGSFSEVADEIKTAAITKLTEART